MTQASKLHNFELMCLDYKDDLKEEYSLLEKQKENRKIAWIINIAILVVCSIMGLLYLLNVNHFKSDGDLMEQAIQMGIHLLPWVVISFISLIVCTLYEEYSSKLSIEIIKGIIKVNGRKPLKAIIKNNQLKINIARISILVIAVVFIITGIFNGGASDVLQKAINICTECIGLG
jgi:purine-cytosine permease-like protein